MAVVRHNGLNRFDGQVTPGRCSQWMGVARLPRGSYSRALSGDALAGRVDEINGLTAELGSVAGLGLGHGTPCGRATPFVLRVGFRQAQGVYAAEKIQIVREADSTPSVRSLQPTNTGNCH